MFTFFGHNFKNSVQKTFVTPSQVYVDFTSALKRVSSLAFYKTINQLLIP